MDDTPILDGLDPEIVDTLVSRRDAIAASGALGGLYAAGAALGSIPIALGALASTAHGQPTSQTVIDVLQFALLLENLESEFYKAVLGTSTVTAFNNAFATVRAALSATDRATFSVISAHEIAHVNVLRAAIAGAGATPNTFDPEPTFDFTGNMGNDGDAPFAAATTSRDVLLALAQGLEDTGVRAYKGQAGNLLRAGDALQVALQIHAVEARHAARIRRIRRTSATNASTNVRYSGTVLGDGVVAAGLTNASSLPSVFADIYAGEGNTSHVVNNGTADATINAVTLGNLPTGAEVSQAFDEPLTRAQVVAIVQRFIKQDIS